MSLDKTITVRTKGGDVTIGKVSNVNYNDATESLEIYRKGAEGVEQLIGEFFHPVGWWV